MSQKYIIDCHLHPYSEAKCFEDTANSNGIQYTREGLESEWKKSKVVAGIAMGVSETAPGLFPDKNAPSPMIPELDNLPNNLFYCLGVNPYKQSESDLESFENALKADNAIGIKIYGGYYHEYVYDDIYAPFYELARKYEVPVVVHAADVFRGAGGLKYAHPLTVDTLAGKYPDLKFVLCHLGDPWCMDAAITVARNPNVYTDMSGLIVGNEEKVRQIKGNMFSTFRWKEAINFLEYYGEGCLENALDKVMFGTDWPLAPYEPYINFIEELIPPNYHNRVFAETALNVFPKLKEKLLKKENRNICEEDQR